jgi:TPR repeat protein
VPQDYAEAAQWYRKAADQGNAEAQGNLGSLYEDGRGVPKDYAEATKWYHKAADQGNQHAQIALDLLNKKENGGSINNANNTVNNDPRIDNSQGIGDKIDAALGDCEDNNIATGRYFLVDLDTGSLNLKHSSLKLMTTCQKEVDTWITQCERESGNSKGCTQSCMTVTQMLLKDAWAHRNNLTAWKNRQ